jgi:hypothetical protein
VPYAVLIEQPDRLLQVLAGGHAEAEMIQAHPVRVETVIGGRYRPPNKTPNASSAPGSPGGGDSTATWKPNNLV